MAKKITLTRQELYERVWTIPVSKLSKELGISDVGLAKVCKRHGIPRPGLGYWARIAHRQKIRKEPLPALSPGQSEVIEFAVNDNPDAAKIVDRYEDTRAELARIQQRGAAFDGGQSDRLKHPLVVGLQKVRRELQTQTEGWISVGHRSFPDVRVTPQNWDRGLRIMDTVLVAAERLGYTVQIDSNGETVLKVLGEDIPFGLREKILRSEAAPPDRSDGKFYPIGKTYQYSPTGLLTLSIKNLYLDGARVNWSDTTRARLEDQIGEFLKGVVEAVARLRVRRSIIEEREREWEEARRIREERVRQEQRERERVQELMRDAENWQKASILRSYISARVKADQKGAEGGSVSKDRLEWLKWASKYADSIDPLVESGKNSEK